MACGGGVGGDVGRALEGPFVGGCLYGESVVVDVVGGDGYYYVVAAFLGGLSWPFPCCCPSL